MTNPNHSAMIPTAPPSIPYIVCSVWIYSLRACPPRTDPLRTSPPRVGPPQASSPQADLLNEVQQ
ncbi:unnamed protein product [Penicillium salamii]|nr:unnamed protein product [Penicillium salamii]CAG8156547.1 unnamed protein product [Penicillium salamii]CAG8233394.1 unnamed protein product [Penicillium salamii]CAG8351406.1 unnamed protein product [Penicillium salamii]CAG8406166.1 unnamed protein product [Penicillium salamii]